MMLNPEGIIQADKRINPYIEKTPVLSSSYLNDLVGADLFFKCEGLQTTGAFKLRGALNALLTLKDEGSLPKHVVAFSSGNHAQAVAYACKTLGIKATIFISESSSDFKIEATRDHGAEVILTKTKAEAEERALEMQQTGAYFLPPFDNDDVILGQGTSCYEALLDGLSPDVIIAPVGGGGLISGTYLAAQLLSPSSSVIGAEPKLGNDAFQSLKTGKIVRWHDAPNTIADGARTLSISERTFEYIKQLDGIIEAEEEDIKYWTRMLFLHLKVTVEPTSAVAMAACSKWLKAQTGQDRKSVLIILSGGNIDANTYRKIWDE
ncbi:serine/threonine dehydratase [Pontibacterium sp. N1Y112]|uniref:Serine/threonine dehydratase n=1 Tax=Pontibacterium sinense TaxID=2781979 RepID=A0A8J7FG11_9GAMM|nr:serine/threonine dehydratase [Pontibacterium sinense]MBE9398899.1 serine/threonine dehydratase [Pontibacterium sinense]